jgi:hypothetical protein
MPQDGRSTPGPTFSQEAHGTAAHDALGLTSDARLRALRRNQRTSEGLRALLDWLTVTDGLDSWMRRPGAPEGYTGGDD